MATGGGDWSLLAAALVEREVARVRDSGVAQANEQLDAAEKAFAVAVGGDEAFAAVVASAELDETEARVLALCAGVELDRRLQLLVRTLRHDPGAARLDLDLLARLLGPDAVDCLADDARLCGAALLEVEEQSPLAAATIVVPRRVAWAMRDDISLDPALPHGCELIEAPVTMPGTEPLVLIYGEDRVRRLQAAVTVTAGLLFLATPEPADDTGWRVLVRQATVGGLGVVLDLTANPAAEPAPRLSPLGRRWVERADHLSWAVCSRDPLDVANLPDRDYVEIAAATPEVSDTEWQAVFPDSEPPARKPTATQLRLAAQSSAPGMDSAAVVRRVSSGAMLKHARRVLPQATWDSLVLPASQERALRGLVDRYRHRITVHEKWGLPLFPSPGVVALFSGPSGTGKSTAAEVLAHELGVDMFRVDLSALVSKYIGETEKNLEEIFSAAHAGDYLLLFDEADSLFGNRSKVSDSRDRYANMEVSYLLQRLETYDGFVVLTSNFQGNIDPAFQRRLHQTVHFTVPSPVEREAIWLRSLAAAPTDDLDLGFVAEQFDLSGGSIRNAALTAAFAAAAADGPIGMGEVLRAVSAELTKLGRRPHDGQFGRWLPEVAD